MTDKISIKIVYDDANERAVSEYTSVDEAVEAAIELADKLGAEKRDAHPTPKRVIVIRDGLPVVTIQIVPGGLLSRKGNSL